MSDTSSSDGEPVITVTQLQTVVEQQRQSIRACPVLSQLLKWKFLDTTRGEEEEEGIMLLAGLGDHITFEDPELHTCGARQLALALEFRDRMTSPEGKFKKLVIRDPVFTDDDKTLLEASFPDIEVQLMSVIEGPDLSAEHYPDCVADLMQWRFVLSGQDYRRIDFLYGAFLPLEALATLLIEHRPKSALIQNLELWRSAPDVKWECLTNPHNEVDRKVKEVFEEYNSEGSEFVGIRLDLDHANGTRVEKSAVEDHVLYCSSEAAADIVMP